MKNEKNCNIMVSIAMITYNHERFIRDALDSILIQKVDFPIEVIIGEDFSTDNTRYIIEEYRKKYPELIKPIYRERNLGMIKNSIDVIKRCRGKYIAFLEGDDVWTDTAKLQKQVDYLEENPEYIAVAHECRLINQVGEVISEKLEIHNLEHGEYLLEHIERNEMPGQTATLMIRSFNPGELDNIIKELKWALIPLDRILPLILLSKGKIHVIDEIMSSYRYYIETNGTNWTSTHDIYYKKLYLLYYCYSKIEEKTAKKFNIKLNKQSYRAQLFVQCFRRAKRDRLVKCYLQCVAMFFMEVHKVKYYRNIMEYRLHK